MVVPDESWPMVEEAVFRLFAEIADSHPDEHVCAGLLLAQLGWSEIESEYPVEAGELLFRARGRSLAQTDCLDRVMLAELGPLIDGPVDAVVFPELDDSTLAPKADRFSGIVIGPPRGRLAVVVSGPGQTVSLGLVEADRIESEPVDTFDTSLRWTRVRGELRGASLVDARIPWASAVSAAHRALGTELVTLGEEMLRLSIEHARSRFQFGSPIGSFQSPRHALAEASAQLAGARALLDETWRYGDELSAVLAKAMAGRAHRVMADTALQICGAIGLTLEHDLHRYVMRGFQLDALLGSYSRLEEALGEQLTGAGSSSGPLPMIGSCG